jgi:HPt (histidine-containing phosphotransfer) domain-containing protein
VSFSSRPIGEFGLATLAELFDNDQREIAGLLIAAMAAIEQDCAAIFASVQQADRRTTIEAAHRIRGTSGSIGAQRLVEISAQIEAAALQPLGSIPPDMLADLRDAADRVCAEIAAYVRSGAEER